MDVLYYIKNEGLDAAIMTFVLHFNLISSGIIACTALQLKTLG